MLFSSKYLYMFQNIYKKKHLLGNLYKALWEDRVRVAYTLDKYCAKYEGLNILERNGI